jgi:beta-mannosidase
MTGRVRSVSTNRRQFLSVGWQMCAAPVGAFENPGALADANLDWIAFTAPGTVASGLRAAQRWSLDGPPRRFDAEEWWFRTQFQVPAADPHATHFLGFDGLATVAEVWLDGQPVLTSDNMFVACEQEIAPGGEHELVIRFKALDTLLAARRPRPRWKTPMVENQQLRWFRTTLLGRTPGWSPPAAAVGPWKPVWIESRSRVTVHDVKIDSQLRDASGFITIKCAIEGLSDTSVRSVDMMVSRGGQRWTASLSGPDADGVYGGNIEISNPDLWWPHTHGEPALYDVSLHVVAANDAAPIEIDLGATGFRTITLRHDAGDFELQVNGVRIFCRGACWTPLDVVTLSSSPEAYRTALTQVRDAGMNMLRIGGTMVYESDDFLDLCDSLGILLWQDFMFANMDYPEDDSAFLESVRNETQQQLARLAARPAVAILCGNSEVEQQAAMWGAPRERWNPPLFHEFLRQIAQSLCPGVPYWPSSAHGGSFPHQPDWGTTSYYGVGAYLRPAEDARRSQVRFATECLGFANVPEDSSIARMPGGLSLRVHHPQWKARSPRDLGAGWDFDDVRDFYLESLFRVDARQLRYADHDRYLELSRVVPGEMMAAAFAEWRSGKSACNGALVWFLKDLWAGAGWGVIDSDQQPKAAYYYLRRALQPVTVAISDEGVNGIAIHLVNERAEEVAGTLELSLYRDGEVLVSSASRSVHMPARENVQIAALDLFDTFSDLSYAYRFGPPSHHVVVARLLDLNVSPCAAAFFFPAGMQLPFISDAGLVGTAKLQANGDALLTLRAARFAQSVTITAAGYAAEDQYFHLAPQHERVIRLRPLRDSVKLKGTIKALNAKAVTKIEIVE